MWPTPKYGGLCNRNSLQSKLSKLSAMGMVFGKIDVECMPYTVLEKHRAYEIRDYPKAVVAQTSMGGGHENNAFGTLARHICVFGKAKNRVDSKIAMTGPVLTTPQPIAMTAPVVTESDGNTMSFVMPKELTIETAPKPTNQNVTIKEIPHRKCAVMRFTWNVKDKDARLLAEDFRDELRKDGLNPGKWSLARFNPPFTIPFLRTNEILVDLDVTDT